MMTKDELNKILEKHSKWLRGRDGGEKANLCGAVLRGIDLSWTNLSRADLCGANLRNADLIWANLSKANLRRLNLSDANLRRANLSVAGLSKANLSVANLSWAGLSGANLYGANLHRANLKGANLHRANLKGANLHRANLRGANLDGADLRGTNLSGAIIDDTCLDEMSLPTGASDRWEQHVTRSGQVWVRGWRTRKSTHVGSTTYTPGLYVAPYFSTAQTECHPGIYLFPTREKAESWGQKHNSLEVVEVWTLADEVHEVGEKARAKWVIA